MFGKTLEKKIVRDLPSDCVLKEAVEEACTLANSALRALGLGKRWARTPRLGGAAPGG